MRRSRTTILCGLLLAAPGVQAADNPKFEWTLRGADEPTADKKQWDQGAALAYNSINGKETWQTDAVLKLVRTELNKSSAEPEKVTPIKTTLNVGAYLHKLTGSDNPANDRGFTLGISQHRIPSGSANGAVVDYDFGLNGSIGKTLKKGAAGDPLPWYDVNKRRLTATAAMYFQPTESSYFFKLIGGLYADQTSNSSSAALNGRESGILASIQYSVYPFGMTPADNKSGPWIVAPLFTLKAQRQRDISATGGRELAGYNLYSAVLSFPFSLAGTDPGFIPSIDIKRSFGADLLQGRARSGQTSVQLAFKF